MTTAVPDPPDRRVPYSAVTDLDRLDDRLPCVTVLYGSNLGLGEDGLEWVPDDLPPTSGETVAWLWLCRPDLRALWETAAPEELSELMTAYADGALAGWWAARLGQ